MPKRRRVLLVQTWWKDLVLRGVAEYASTHNWELDCLMHWTHRLPAPGEWKGDGMIAFAGVSRKMLAETRRLVALVKAARVPVVDMQPLADFFGAPKVFVPHEAVGRMAAEYFLGLNFRDFGFVTFDENLLERARRTAFQRAVERGGARFHALTPSSLRRGIARLPRPMALFAVNDPNALDVIRLCRDAGASVPEEFAVLGVDDTEIVCELAGVPLSSINCNFERQGYEAAALLDRLMRGEKPPREPVTVQPRGVTVRRSTDTIAIPEPEAARLLRYLRDHYAEPLTLQQLGEAAGVRLREANRTFRRHVGRSMLQELTRLRVTKAQLLLRGERQKLERVAQECGFSSRFHFVRAFVRCVGLTPSAWRRQARAGIS